MRRFFITSAKFTGQAELLYTASGILSCIDATNTNMDEETIKAFKRAVPANIAGLAAGEGFSADTVIVEADFEVDFNLFWKDYPLHRNRYKAEQLFNKMAKTEQVKAYHNLKLYKDYCRQREWYTPMMADKYLRSREYETEWNKIR